MLDITKLLACAGNNVAETLNKVDPAQIEEIASAIAESKRVFTAGWGRAGNVVRILGMDMSQICLLYTSPTNSQMQSSPL